MSVCILALYLLLLLCRTLADLSFQVESSTREFSRLQEKLEQGHRRDLEEKEEALKAREDNLKGSYALDAHPVTSVARHTP